MIRRAVAFAAVALATWFVGPSTALADPAGPTDYRSEVVSIDPPVPGLEVSIVGGDSFVHVTASPGTDVLVLGYAAEPYLWIQPDGSVVENRRSPATYYNEERYGAEIPTAADAAAAPEWVRIGSGGSWAWHDHRAHRMEPFAPVNASRGDQILDEVIPVVVDGVPVDIRISSVWQPAPSRLPMIAGLVLAGLAVGAVAITGRSRALAPLALTIATAAAVVGLLQFRSLPSSTAPSTLWWLAPVAAMGFSLVAIWLEWRAGATSAVSSAATAVAGLQLVVWGVERRVGLVRAVLPTDAPFWFDRLVTAAALAIGLGAAALAIVSMVRVEPRPHRSARPAR